MEQKKLEDYITDEANDSELYRNMAAVAPDKDGSDMLMKMSDDEAGHMRAFQKAYHSQFNKYFTPRMRDNSVSREDYGRVLRGRIPEEAEAYRMYARDAMDKRNLMMHTTLVNISHDENVHMGHVIYLLWKLCGCTDIGKPVPPVETLPPVKPIPPIGTVPPIAPVPPIGIIPPVVAPPIDCNSRCDERIKVLVSMARAWEQHIWWTRNLIISILANMDDANLVAAELLKNPRHIANIFEPYYGRPVADAVNKLITEHLDIGGKIIKAVADDKTEEVNKLNKQWYANADEIAKTFAGFNPNYKESEVKRMMYAHLDNTTAELLARRRGQHAEEIRAFNKVEAEANGMADYFANGIIKDKICR